MRIFIIYLFLTTTFAKAQKPTISFSKLTCPEKMWVILHPFIANKTRKLTNDAIKISNEMKMDSSLDGDASGGQVDAFRHGYWMALLSRNICWKKALRLGKTHEKGSFKKYKKGIADEEGSRPDSVSSEMDLFNNKIGAALGCNYKDTSIDSLRIIVKNAVLSGQMLIISKNAEGIALDSLGKPIDFSGLENYWKVPKILVSSDKGKKAVIPKQ
jgi:hypothetical protein